MHVSSWQLKPLAPWCLQVCNSHARHQHAFLVYLKYSCLALDWKARPKPTISVLIPTTSPQASSPCLQNLSLYDLMMFVSPSDIIFPIYEWLTEELLTAHVLITDTSSISYLPAAVTKRVKRTKVIFTQVFSRVSQCLSLDLMRLDRPSWRWKTKQRPNRRQLLFISCQAESREGDRKGPEARNLFTSST